MNSTVKLTSNDFMRIEDLVATHVLKATWRRENAMKWMAIEERNTNVIRHLSKRISDAWLVVEKMTENGWRTDIAVSPIDGKTICSFDAYDVPKANGVADTAPLAICLAALAAHGIDVEVKEEGNAH